jgi:hypothetical protein
METSDYPPANEKSLIGKGERFDQMIVGRRRGRLHYPTRAQSNGPTPD